jgi:putative ABC transport system permease protein
MAAGVFGLGTILTASSILSREVARTYDDTRPASATLFTDAVSDALVDAVRRAPGVADAEARPVIRGRVRVGEEAWAPLVLFAVRNFDDLRLDRFTREAGAWPPADDEILLERTALPVARAGIGEIVTVSTAERGERRLRVAGSVHAPGLAPAWMDHVVSGFVTWRSVMRGDAMAESAAIRIVVTGDRLDEARIREIADGVKAVLVKDGRPEVRIDVPPPGRHPHADQMDTFLFLLGSFGLLTCALSAVLVASMIHALTIEQVRQIGVMKAIGASTGQVAALYLGQVAILGLLALGAGVPLGVSAGRGYARFSATILNASIASEAVPLRVILIQIAVGLALPLAVALVPVRLASRISIHRAFSQDLAGRSFGSGAFDRGLARIGGIPRPLRLSLRSAFHRRGRLALTVGTLAAGGAVFVSALNVSAAWSRAVASEFEARRYDVEVRLSRPYPSDLFAGAIAALPEVARAESWPDAAATIAGADGESGPRVSLVGVEKDSTLFDPILVSGRWLTGGDEASVVVNQSLQARAPSLRVGSDVALIVNGRKVAWPIVGVLKEIDPTPIAYAPARAVLDAAGLPAGTARSVRVVTRRHDSEGQLSASRDLERLFRRVGVGVLAIQPLLDRRKAIDDHLVIIRSALVFASALVLLVGGLGLTSALSLSVLERTREIGILGAIGASPRTIAGHVVLEGMLMGALSWGAALALAAPITWILDAAAGRIFIKSPLEFFMSPGAAAVWLALVFVLAGFSSFYPAWRAGRLAVREALAYE